MATEDLQIRLSTVGTLQANGLGSISSEASAADASISKLSSSFLSFGNIVKGAGIAAAFAGVGAVVGQVGESLIDTSNAMGSFNNVMTAFGKSKNEIDAVSKSMQEYAASTVYNTSDLLNVYGQLDKSASAAGYSTESIIKGLGNVASTTPDATNAMSALAFVMPQIASSGKLMGQDLNQMMNALGGSAGLVVDQWNKDFGTSFTSLKELSGESSAQMMQVMQELGNNPALEKIATTPQTIGAAWQGMVETIANALLPAFQSLTAFLIPIISGFGDFVAALFGATNGAAQAGVQVSGLGLFFNSLGSAVGQAFAIIAPALTSFIDSMMNVWNAVNPIVNLIIGIFGQLLGSAITIFASILSVAINFASSIIAFLSPIIQFISGMLLPIFEAISSVVSSVYSVVASVFASIASTIQSYVSAVISFVQPLIDVFKNVGNAIGGFLGMMSMGETGIDVYGEQTFAMGANNIAGALGGMSHAVKSKSALSSMPTPQVNIEAYSGSVDIGGIKFDRLVDRIVENGQRRKKIAK